MVVLDVVVDLEEEAVAVGVEVEVEVEEAIVRRYLLKTLTLT